jgi:hypothetical protein
MNPPARQQTISLRTGNPTNSNRRQTQETIVELMVEGLTREQLTLVRSDPGIFGEEHRKMALEDMKESSDMVEKSRQVQCQDIRPRRPHDRSRGNDEEMIDHQLLTVARKAMMQEKLALTVLTKPSTQVSKTACYHRHTI